MNSTRTPNATIPTRTLYIPTTGTSVVRSSFLDETSLANLLGGKPRVLLIAGADWETYVDRDAGRDSASPNPLANRLARYVDSTFPDVIYGPVLIVGRSDSGEPHDLSWPVVELARHLF